MVHYFGNGLIVRHAVIYISHYSVEANLYDFGAGLSGACNNTPVIAVFNWHDVDIAVRITPSITYALYHAGGILIVDAKPLEGIAQLLAQRRLI